MRLAVAATPDVALPTLNSLLDSEHDLVLVITQPDRPAGRGRALTESAVSRWASQTNILCVKPQQPQELSHLLENIDLVITIGYGVLLPEELLTIPRFGFLNLHFSLLPQWRGAAPVQRAIENGDLVTGVTVFKLDAGMDTGPILVQKRFAIDSDITTDELLSELSELGVEAITDSLAFLSRGDKPLPQSNTGSSRALKLSKSEGEIDWSTSAKIISQKIRAFTSNPGAWTRFRGEVLRIGAFEITEFKVHPGVIETQGGKVLIGTGDFALSILTLTPSGKSTMPASSWLNGARLQKGERVG